MACFRSSFRSVQAERKVEADPRDQRAADAAELERLGYAQQLLRDIGGFSNFALSFSIISILTGAVTLYGHGLKYGGPLVMSVGWPIVTVLTLAIAASLAELASAYPTAGALYHWAARFGGPGWGFLTAWLNTIGQFAITAGIDYGLAEFVVAMMGWPPDRSRIFGIFAAILFSHAALNHVGVRVVAKLNDLSAWYHILGSIVIIGALVALAPKRDLHFVTSRFTVAKEGVAYGFLVGLLQAGWTFTGYDASAHVTEETLDPRRNAPWGIFMAVLVSGIVGWVMLLVVTIAIRDLQGAVDADNPFIFVLRSGLGVRLGNALVWVIIGAMWFCGLASVTSNSRMLFAFARDGGLPASAALARVSARFQSPHIAVWVSAIAALFVAVWAKGLAAMTALSTIALYASYAAPIFLGMRARRRGEWTTRGPWTLGRWSSIVNVIAVTWVITTMVLFVLPPNLIAGYTFAGCLALLGIYWFAYMRARFKGPRLPGSTADPVVTDE